MSTNSNGKSIDRTQISVDVPLRDDRLFRREATGDLLIFLVRHDDEAFSMTDLAEAVGYTRTTVTKTIDLLSNNDLVDEERAGTRRLVRINRDRLTRPNDPILEIPQPEFHTPVRIATKAILDDLDDILAVVLYGSVARGEADRRSDIDLWVLVREDRMSNQRQANHVRQALEEQTFDGDRYAFEIDVEGLQAVPNYPGELREIIGKGIAVHRTSEFDTVRKMVLHGDADE